MAYKVLITRAAERDLKRPIPSKYKQEIDRVILSLGSDPRPPGSKKLRGLAALYRLAVGDYRVIYSVSDKAREGVVEKVGDRKEVYRYLR